MGRDAVNAEAQAAFCADEWPRLVGALSLYCGDRDVAEEVAQEALARAVERWGQVSGMAAPGAWVHRVALNLAASRFRRRGAERRANARHGGQPVAEHDADAAERLAVRAALARLPRRQREVVVLRFYLGYPLAEAARMLSISTDAAAAHTHRAMTVLRGRLLPSPAQGRDRDAAARGGDQR